MEAFSLLNHSRRHDYDCDGEGNEEKKEEDEDGNIEGDESEEQSDGDDAKSDDGSFDGDDREFNFTLSSGSSSDPCDPNLTLSPSDDLFFKGRDNSKSQKQQSSEDSVSDEKKFTKDVMQKYLKKVKPLYVRVSRRYGEKLKFSGQLSLGSLKPAATPPSTAAQKPVSGKATTVEKGQVEAEGGKNLKQVNIPAGLRVVCKHLGKSRSASSAVAASPPAPTLSKRRDDSLLQQQDGIQSAILHCKRSFNGCQDSSESSVLPRSVSDPSHEKSINLSRNSSPDEAKA
ncbi:hypothetical protein GOBAR_AA23698 [Gossypium barbadense]|uniref:Membrane-associated kinase regulator 2 n=1 Tax=Gossypium barbadense TaxID=3634 RepID=A0A2P5X0V4_GOSBA|nr:hypothetical protein GOBAR_AA23698 [Gossypium barbadense]